MEWNTEVLFVERKPPSDIVQALPDIYAAVHLERRFEDVISKGLAPHMAAARVGPWSVLFAPGVHLAERTNLLERLSRGTRLLAVVISPSSAGFVWYEQGKLERRLHSVRGVVDQDEGDPLPEEGAPGEFSPLVLIRRLTGISVEDLEKARYGLVVMG